jgi:hypothetical protein
MNWLERHAIRLALLLLLVSALMLLLSGCATQPPVLAPSAQPRLPPLPMEARQPPAPDWCSPTCSAGVERDLSSWATTLTGPQPPEPPASEPMTR